MQKELVYLSSEGNTVKKEGKNQGKPYYVHTFLMGKESFNVFEFADEMGIFKFYDFIIKNGVERLNVLNGEFDVFVRDGKLNATLVELERVL